jgi:hypothetical protein
MQLAQASQEQHRRFYELFGTQPSAGAPWRDLSTHIRTIEQGVDATHNGVIASSFSTAVLPRYTAATRNDSAPFTRAATTVDTFADITDASARINIDGANTVAAYARSEAAAVSTVPDPDSPEGLARILGIIHDHQTQATTTVTQSAAAESELGQQAAAAGGTDDDSRRQPGSEKREGDPTIQMVDHGTETEDPNQPPAAAPPDGSGPMSDAQIKSVIDEMLEGQDLSPAEAAQLADILRNDLQGALDNGLNAEDAYTRAENAATTFMSQLHRSYVRKSTRLGIFEDSLRTPEGDFLSEVTGDVIPAMRDAAGELIWVDQATGTRVAEGTPNSMTIPEKGAFHLGHDFGSENWRILRQAMEEGWTQSELNDFINNHEHFRLETPAENWGHAHEDRGPYVPNPAWTPDRLVDGAAAGSGVAGGTAPYISLPPNMPNVFDHPPVALPNFDGTHSPAPGLPPLAPTPGLPPWLIGPPEAGHIPGYNPLNGPFGVNIDSPPVVAPPGWTPPDLSIDLPDVHVTPEDAAEAGGFLAGVGAVLVLLGKAASSLVHPFS